MVLIEGNHEGKHFCLKKYIVARLKFVQKPPGVPKCFWKMFYGQMRKKVNILAKMHNAVFEGKRKRHCIPTPKSHPSSTVKHGVGCVMIWSRSAASGPGHLRIIVGAMNSKLCQHILEENVKTTVHNFKLKRGWMMQQDSDPKHTSISRKNGWKRWKFIFWKVQIRVLTWTQLRCCGMIWRQDSSKLLKNWDSCVWTNDPKFLVNHCANVFIKDTHNRFLTRTDTTNV